MCGAILEGTEKNSKPFQIYQRLSPVNTKRGATEMKKEITDKAIDDLMRTLLDDAGHDEDVLNEIADSPSIWWGVQRNIAKEASPYSSPWPPPKTLWKMLLIGFPATAAAALLLVFFFSTKPAKVGEQAVVIPTEQKITAETKPESSLPIASANTGTTIRTESDVERHFTPRVAKGRTPSLDKTVAVRKANRPIDRSAENSVKTDFIALSYADNPESGQIVKVKVPSSMMVTLGLVASVQKPSSLVDAEVLVGDDGLTHSIRFIRKSL